MAKDSCVRHSQQSYYLELRRDYVDLFDGDHCAAVLLGFFEYMTNGEIARMKHAGETGDPWIKTSMPCMFEDTLGLYSIRALQQRIDRLMQSGILQVQTGRIGTINRYLFSYEMASSMLDSRKVISVESIGNFADDNQSTSEKTTYDSSAKTTHGSSAKKTLYKEESLITNHLSEETNSLPSSEKTYTETRVELEQQLGRSLKNSEMSRLQAQAPYPDGPDVMEWAKSKNIIDEAKSKTKWPKRDGSSKITPEFNPPSPQTTAVAISERSEMESDSQFVEYIATYTLAGKPINPTKHSIPAWRKWKMLSQPQRDGSLRDAQRQAIQTRDGMYLPSPIDHLNTSPWETVAMARVLPTIAPQTGKRDVNAEAREMYYREHPELRPQRTA